MNTEQPTPPVMTLDETIGFLKERILCYGSEETPFRSVVESAIHHLEAGKAQGIRCDGREFPSPLAAALHLLWLLQRLSFYEPHREGQPADGPRFREGIIEARKLLEALDYERTAFGPPTNPEQKGT